MVRVEGLQPPRPFSQMVLSQPRLAFRHTRIIFQIIFLYWYTRPAFVLGSCDYESRALDKGLSDRYTHVFHFAINLSHIFIRVKIFPLFAKISQILLKLSKISIIHLFFLFRKLFLKPTITWPAHPIYQTNIHIFPFYYFSVTLKTLAHLSYNLFHLE